MKEKHAVSASRLEKGRGVLYNEIGEVGWDDPLFTRLTKTDGREKPFRRSAGFLQVHCSFRGNGRGMFL